MWPRLTSNSLFFSLPPPKCWNYTYGFSRFSCWCELPAEFVGMPGLASAFALIGKICRICKVV
jgi:hypothetical protein